MDIKKPKELTKFIQLLRKQGVVSYKSGDFSIELAREALFPESNYIKNKKSEPNGDQVIVENSLSEEELLYWSSAGIPSEQKEAN